MGMRSGSWRFPSISAYTEVEDDEVEEDRFEGSRMRETSVTLGQWR